MKRFMLIPIMMVLLLLLTSCKLESLEKRTFVFESFSFLEGDFEDLVPEKVKKLEEGYKTIKYVFEDDTVGFYMDVDGEQEYHVYDYTFIDNELIINDNSGLTYYIKNNKLSCKKNMQKNRGICIDLS